MPTVQEHEVATSLSAKQAELVQHMAKDVHVKSGASAKVAGESAIRLSHPLNKPLSKKVVLNQADLQKLVTLVPKKVPPPALPSQLGPWNFNITFDDGVPVGGSASLTLFQDGSYAFNGNFHDSGFPSYDVEFALVVVSGTGRGYSFTFSGHTAGTAESGSRDAGWTNQGQNDDLAANWADLTASWSWRWEASVNWSVSSAVDSLVSALKAAGTVVATVIPIVVAIAAA